ncbi:ferroptosis suppressor protein 1-like [Ptychodera flava]|uniref:ferroptosis suppressor protein 1-like n=1 Tax=Ptychodera flava TaxID=63121 RepID=UPI00396A787D
MGNSSSDLPETTHIVIVGGGFAGCQLATRLKDKGKFTLIDSREAMHMNIGALRSSVEPGFAKKTMIPYKEMFGENFKQGVVRSINIEDKSVILVAGDEVIHYTHLVIATGSLGMFPAKLMMTVAVDDALSLYKTQIEEIQSAKSIVIIGGGAVGVELAGEIATEYKDKQVTLVHPHEHLVNAMLSESFQKEVKSQLEALNVKLILCDRVTNKDEIPDDYTKDKFIVKTKNGVELEADLAIRATGLRVNSMAYSGTMADKMNDRERLKVNEFLEVIDCTNVYAIGDCNNVQETKMAYRAGLQADLLAANLIKESQGKPKSPYKPAGHMMLLSIGRNGGAFQLPNGFVLGGFVTRYLKSRDVFVGKYWKDFGLKEPTE